MVDEVEEKFAAPFLVNRALSYHKDAIYFVNEMNTDMVWTIVFSISFI